MANKENISHEIDKNVISMMTTMAAIYKNKSSDEYKMHGDITLSPGYHTIERMLADLSTLRDFPKNYVSDMKSLFNVLHRPIFKKMVTQYLTDPNDECAVLITAIFTVGYRLIVGELSRIYASTEATENGIIYKPDALSKRHDMSRMVAAYRLNVESKLDAYIRDASKQKHVQEAWYDSALNFIFNGPVIGRVVGYFTAHLNNFFQTITTLNPISLIDNIFTKHYDAKVQSLNDIAATYEATKQAYDDYMKLPDSQRKRKIEHKYMKELKKYNIKMQNMQAKLAHYDQRAIEEASENSYNIDMDKLNGNDQSPNTTPSSNTSNSDDDFDF